MRVQSTIALALLGLASADPRVVAGAAVGGTVSGASDRWFDLDLTFGLRTARRSPRCSRTGVEPSSRIRGG
jgi:hypothetical protein